MSTTVTKTIATALWVYENPEGKRRIAYRGEDVTVTAAEADRGEKAGAFDQPPAGTVTIPNLPHDVRAENFAGIYDVIESRTPVPPSDEVVAPLRHDISPVVATSDDAEGDEAQAEAGDVPPRDANKPEVVEWVANNLTKSDGEDYTKSELNRMNKDELWDLIDSVEA